MTPAGSESVGAVAAAAGEALRPMAALDGVPSPGAPVAGRGAASATGFGSLVAQGLEQVNQHLVQSQQDLQQLAVGEVENLHQTMIRLEEARLSFQLAMQVRNRLLEAYQDVLKMPV